MSILLVQKRGRHPTASVSFSTLNPDLDEDISGSRRTISIWSACD